MANAKYGLLGWQIQHSLSPVMHNAAFRAEGLAADYRLYEVAPQKIAEFWQSLEADPQLVGLNVTTPYKKWVFDQLVAQQAYLDESARLGQSVNTLVRSKSGAWQGYSTDGLGFWQAAMAWQPKQVLLLGVGGAARAIIKAQPEGVNLMVANREGEHFQGYADFIAAQGLPPLRTLDQVDAILPQVDLVVDATTVGATSFAAILRSEQIKKTAPTTRIVDLKYHQSVTPIMALAKEVGRPTENGLGMLIEQGRLSYALWQGHLPAKEFFVAALHKQ